jgi:hypothetical protein
MNKFARRFDFDALGNLHSAPPLVRELFNRWALPGEVGWVRHPRKLGCIRKENHKLRIAVRNGYLNLYVAGQSVAEIRASKSLEVRVKIHQKYLNGLENNGKTAGAGAPGDQRMITLRGAELAPADPAAVVDGWIRTAATYCGSEKLFVDQLVSHNANVIDMEMALPGATKHKGVKIAPRMDLVVVDLDGVPSLNFWEAKCVNNKELRAQAEIDVQAGTGAAVARQLKSYMQWLITDGREDCVLAGYRDAAKVLLALAEKFGKDLESPACLNWRSLVDLNPTLVRRPGLVIGNFHPNPRSRADVDTMRNAKYSFVEGPHYSRIVQMGLEVVVMDRRFHTASQLPSLKDGALGNWNHN